MTVKEMGIDLNGKNIEAVVFDLDGTFYNIGFFTKLMFLLHNIRNLSLFSAHRKIMKTLRNEDFGSGEKYFDTLFGRISELTGKNKKNIKGWYLTDFRKDFILTLAKSCKKNKDLERVAGILKKINLKTAILSDFGFIEERLEALNIDRSLFDILVSGEEEGALKPQTRPLIKISEHLAVNTENSVLIGDRDDTDKAVAENTGMVFIDVKNISNLENILKVHISGVV
ncbi:MAG TPA: HAD family hydrolase [bacterium]|nr:HAD family hydrolase [bacterium]HOG42490.1 HAD family hydrolase [bacterium]HQM84714.1 HAD family hydrolase [bacterium]